MAVRSLGTENPLASLVPSAAPRTTLGTSYMLGRGCCSNLSKSQAGNMLVDEGCQPSGKQEDMVGACGKLESFPVCVLTEVGQGRGSMKTKVLDH